MDLNERKLKILQAIIRDFVATAEPVGSRTLSKKYDLDISPATIRNEMSDLEDMGFLTHPHTSAGRVPSQKAYRLYVDEIMKTKELTQAEKDEIAAKLYSKATELDETIEHAAKILSDITNLTAFAMSPKVDTDEIRFIDLLPVDERTVVLMIVSERGKVSNSAIKLNVDYTRENLKILAKSLTYNFKGKTFGEALTTDIVRTFQSDIEAMSRLEGNVMPDFMRTLESMLNVNLYMEGLTNIFNIPEYSDLERAKMFMEMIGKKEEFTKKLVNRDDGLLITIGTENMDENLEDCTLITATYEVDGKFVGKLGVVGPTRMKYSEITSVINYLTDNISNSFRLTDGSGKGDEDFDRDRNEP